MSAKIIRKSAINAIPEQFVTVEIHNHTLKKKNRLHRDSIFNELKMTEDLIEETINKKTKFSKKRKIKQRLSNAKELDIEGPIKKVEAFMSPQISLKLRQIKNITKFFEKTCKENNSKHILEKLKRLRRLEDGDDSKSGSGKQVMKGSESECNDEHLGKTMQKLKKQMQYRINSIRSQQSHLQERINLTELSKSMRADDTPQKNSNTFYHRFAASKQPIDKADSFKMHFQQQKIIDLEKFVTGGYQNENHVFSDYVKIAQFQENREKFKILDRIYENVKENSENLWNKMDSSKLQEANMLQFVYLMENDVRINEGDKKALKKRLKLID